MKRCRLTRKTPLRSFSQLKRGQPLSKAKGCYLMKSRGGLKKVSRKKKEQDDIYYPLRDEFLKQNPTCQCCYQKDATDVHHKAGRGKFYLRVDTWLSACRPCHTRITDDRTWAESKGFSLTVAQRRLL